MAEDLIEGSLLDEASFSSSVTSFSSALLMVALKDMVAKVLGVGTRLGRSSSRFDVMSGWLGCCKRKAPSRVDRRKCGEGAGCRNVDGSGVRTC